MATEASWYDVSSFRRRNRWMTTLFHRNTRGLHSTILMRPHPRGGITRLTLCDDRLPLGRSFGFAGGRAGAGLPANYVQLMRSTWLAPHAITGLHTAATYQPIFKATAQVMPSPHSSVWKVSTVGFFFPLKRHERLSGSGKAKWLRAVVEAIAIYGAVFRTVMRDSIIFPT